MDLLRGGYKTKMRFFRSDPVETEVVWYAVPADRPFLPFPSIFCSWEWVEPNNPTQRRPGTVGLGEQIEANRTYPGRPVPPDRDFTGHICGTPLQWLEGEDLPPVPPVPLASDGFPACCGPGLVKPPDPRNCRFQLAALWTLELLATNRAAVPAWVQTNIDPALTVTLSPNDATVVPGTVIAWRRDYSILFVFGTSNAAQWATQLLPAARGPVNQGDYSTHALHALAAFFVLQRFRASDTLPQRPVVIMGHSYGGSVALLVALQLRRLYPRRRIEVYTAGTPKMGDMRLQRLLRQITQVNHVNDGDPVPRLPPSGVEATVMANAILNPGAAGGWSGFFPPVNQRGIRLDGTQYGGVDLGLGAALLASILGNLVRGNPLGAFDAHNLAEYYRRIALTCNDPPPVVVGTVHGGAVGEGRAFSFPGSFASPRGSGVSDGTVHSSPGVTVDVHGGGVGNGHPFSGIPPVAVVYGGGVGEGKALSFYGAFAVAAGGGVGEGSPVSFVGALGLASGGGVGTVRSGSDSFAGAFGEALGGSVGNGLVATTGGVIVTVRGGGVGEGDVTSTGGQTVLVYGGGVGLGDAEPSGGVVALVYGGGVGFLFIILP